MKILCVANLAYSSRALLVVEAMRELGHDVDALSNVPLDDALEEPTPGTLDLAASSLGLPLDRTGFQRAMVRAVRSEPYDLLLVIKCLELLPGTLERVRREAPSLHIAWFSEDDMFAPHNRSRFFTASVPLYDTVVTLKSYNADPSELPSLGARRVLVDQQSFHRHRHRPVEVTPADRTRLGGAVGFIGTFEEARAVSMLRLAESGHPVRVWGNRWPAEWGRRHPNLRIEGRAVTGDDYPRAVCATDINLGFLRKLNRDLHTSRSVEIPACGALLVAERTHEHEALFRDREEAFFFSDDRELVEVVDALRREPALRSRVATAGRARCLRDGYDFHGRFAKLLPKLVERRPQ